MSYSVSFIGKPENVIKALEEHSKKLDGKSKEEFDKVLPNVSALVKENYNNDPASYSTVIRVEVSGHSYEINGKPAYGNCLVNISSSPAVLV